MTDSDFQVLNSTDHADVRVVTTPGERFGDAVMQVMVMPFELRNVQACYPVFFQIDRNDAYYPVALLGFEDGENLFLEGDTWSADYVPAMIRRGPFMVGVKDVPGGKEQARVLSLDMSHPRVSRNEGEALFDVLSGRTQYLEEQAGLLEALHDGLGHCREFTAALHAEGLLEAVTLEISLNDGSRNQLIGLHGINEEKLQELPGEVLERFNREGFLMPLFMVLASMSNVRALIQRKNALVGKGN